MIVTGAAKGEFVQVGFSENHGSSGEDCFNDHRVGSGPKVSQGWSPAGRRIVFGVHTVLDGDWQAE